MGTTQTHVEVPSHASPEPLRHDRPVQHALVSVHAWPLDEQVEPMMHEPTVLPSGTLQLRPEQQSALVVHMPVSGWHAAGAEHLPPEQMLEQHCEPLVHVAPLAEQVPPPEPPSVVPPVPPSDVPPSVGPGPGV